MPVPPKRRPKLRYGTPLDVRLILPKDLADAIRDQAIADFRTIAGEIEHSLRKLYLENKPAA